MTAVLNFSKSLLDLGRTHVANRQAGRGLHVLQKLLDMPETGPAIVAEANYLIGQIHFEKSNYESAEDCLLAALDHDDNHAGANFLLAKTMEKQAGGMDDIVVQQFHQATAVAPNDAVKKCAYGRAMVEYNRSERGVKILRRTYNRNKTNPAVVEEVLNGLLAGRRYADAMKVLRHAEKNKSNDPQFKRICREFNRRRLKENWPCTPTVDRKEVYVVAFPGAVPPMQPPGVAKETGKGFRVFVVDENSTLPKVAVSSAARLLDILDRSTDAHLGRIAKTLGCKESDRVDISNAIARRLENPKLLGPVVKNLPAGSKKLLRTLIRVGGVVPAAVLDQNDPEPGAAHPVAALSAAGLVFVGPDAAGGSGVKAEEIAVIPVDLYKSLAKLNRIKAGVRR